VRLNVREEQGREESAEVPRNTWRIRNAHAGLTAIAMLMLVSTYRKHRRRLGGPGTFLSASRDPARDTAIWTFLRNPHIPHKEDKEADLTPHLVKS
jgi:hypothetical protein